MMRTNDINLSLTLPHYNQAKIVVENTVSRFSTLYGIELEYSIEYGVVKDNTEFIKVAHALNSLDIGVIPYEYIYHGQKFTDARCDGLSDSTTSSIVYINFNIPVLFIQRIGLHKFLYVLKYLHPNLFYYLLNLLRRDETYRTFCNNEFNSRLLKAVDCPVDDIEVESLANFFALNPNNNEIPYAFFSKMNYKWYKDQLPRKPFNQKKYFDILWDVVERLRG